MKNTKYFFLFLTLLSLSNCDREIANVTGKCDKEKKKSNQCFLTSVLACEKTPDAERYRKLGINICTNFDGYLFMIQAFCELPEECKPEPETSSSSRKK
ncbi:hypothetical protein JWG41_14935 [Leptospira sp. 201903075]|uniref:hypothetical protein n=1 Tax=Leptospira chreensis TaxID=2810035 RepID=UPI001965A821|nr:hypothetical protein [Leptospira chreensis]MBM9591749.1 hypothetical protein [Leptospira chreensis]